MYDTAVSRAGNEKRESSNRAIEVNRRSGRARRPVTIASAVELQTPPCWIIAPLFRLSASTLGGLVLVRGPTPFVFCFLSRAHTNGSFQSMNAFQFGAY